MQVLLLDTETDGLDPAVNRCIEVAVCLYDTATASPIESYASLIQNDSNAAEHINRISPQALAVAPDEWHVWPRVVDLADKAEVIVAHRIEFDMEFVTTVLKEREWVCTKTFVEWPTAKSGDHLVHLALHYGLGVVSAHRAATDVDIMARIFTRVAELGYSLDEIFTKARRPRERFVALVPYEKKDLAKDAGFLWDDKKREWYRSMPPEDTAALPFKVRKG
jgi:DNA polymerase-3 subunit epsilon